VKLPLVTLFDSMWGNLEKCHQFDDGTRQMMKPAYQEALTDNACPNLLKLQKEAGLLWNKAGENEFTSACHLAPLLPPTPPPPSPRVQVLGCSFSAGRGGRGGSGGFPPLEEREIALTKDLTYTEHRHQRDQRKDPRRTCVNLVVW